MLLNTNSKRHLGYRIRLKRRFLCFCFLWFFIFFLNISGLTSPPPPSPNTTLFPRHNIFNYIYILIKVNIRAYKNIYGYIQCKKWPANEKKPILPPTHIIKEYFITIQLGFPLSHSFSLIMSLFLI